MLASVNTVVVVVYASAAGSVEHCCSAVTTGVTAAHTAVTIDNDTSVAAEGLLSYHQ